MTADNDINIIAAESTSSEASKNSSSGWNAGVVAAIGSGGTGFGITAGANKGKGKGQGSGEYYTNSVVGTETGKTIIVSGGNTNIVGGEVYGKGVELDVGGDLTIVSTQNRSDYHSNQKDSSVQGAWMLGGGGSVSGSHSQSKIDANYQSVTDQSGIFAGDDGFQVKVEGNTHLSGGVIVANEKAELEGLNSFETGTITSNDLVNKSEYDGEGVGISGGYGYQNDGPNNPKGTNPTQTETVNLPDGSHSVNKNVGYGKDKESESSVTQSGIGTGNIKVTDNEKQKELTEQTAEEATKGIESNLTTETVADNSGAIENIFDKEKVQAEIDLQVKVTQQFDRTRQDMKQIINQKIDEYKDKNPDKAKDWQNAGLLLDMLAGGLSSPGEGLGIVAGAANPAVAQMIKGMVNDGTLEEGGLSHLLAHGIAGAAMAAANGGDLLSGALTAGGAEALAPIIAEFLYGKGKKPEDLTADEKNTLSAIIGILGIGAGALTGDSALDAVIGDSVATNAVENNLTHNKAGSNKLPDRLKELDTKISEHIPSMDEFQEKFDQCTTNECKKEVREEYYKASELGDQKILELYESGELSKEDIKDLVSHYRDAMMKGASEGEKRWENNPSTLSTLEWANTISNSALNAIHEAILIDEMTAKRGIILVILKIMPVMKNS
ncbi:hemagglutinin repeat-containing protein [Ignatzschineria sp. RMDPL8A]|nr:hemagglutinin repeat-containing protein [Ignatzschineria sp. RMDPL8A]MDG9730372.1 hemagglutinin repeat-containing protein [Ignatzschineria sp. RMDPL8A]